MGSFSSSTLVNFEVAGRLRAITKVALIHSLLQAYPIATAGKLAAAFCC
jgi:hypothetical protein